MTGRSQSGSNHRPFHELQITGSCVAVQREVLLEVTYLKIQVWNACVTNDSVLEFYQTVCKVHVKLTIPVLVDLAFDSKTGTADADSVTDVVIVLVLTEENCSVSLDTGVEPELVGTVLGFKNQNTVLSLNIKSVRLDCHSILVALNFFLGEHCRYRKQCNRQQ